ncbi:MAG: hypothetical protein Kow0069_19130 [Promethearchaeota archaeon]
MAKDKLYGLIILVVAAAVLVLYTLYTVVDWYLQTYAGAPLGLPSPIGALENVFNWQFMVLAPMWLIVVLICVIAIWIGYSMLTTPPPVPLDELEAELEAEESAAAASE